ncbi:MAG: hydroxyacid dehydrogenase [Bacteroidetes bacterium]|nr:hydroxyacid dehydrogenase [Bacteroidota bacterium]
MNPTVLLIDSMHPAFQQELEAGGVTTVEGFSWSKEKVLDEIGKYNGIAIRSRFRIDENFISHATQLKCIGRAGAGMENIDVGAAAKAGIHCLNAPEGNRDAVAEHALGMLLMGMNHLLRADAEVRKGIWRREENRGTELRGKTIGVIGFGNMGAAFAQRLQGFGMTILAYDPYIKIDAEHYPFVKQCPKEQIFMESDIISLHVPLTDETKYLVNDSWIKKFRKNIYLINTARGKNIDTTALVKGLKSGKITGAALDVLEYEALSFEQIDSSQLPEAFQYLIQSENVVLSPHIAGWTHESNIKIAQTLAFKMLEVLKT